MSDETEATPDATAIVHGLWDDLAWANFRIAELERALAASDAEVKRMREIVARLPKTADGVAIVPGDVLFYRHPVGGVGSAIVGLNLAERWSCHTATSRGDDSISIGYADCYSTSAAALAKETP